MPDVVPFKSEPSKAVCIKCRHHQEHRTETGLKHLCGLKYDPEKDYDYVTGKIEMKDNYDYCDCYKLNYDGNCKRFEEVEEL